MVRVKKAQRVEKTPRTRRAARRAMRESDYVALAQFRF
jgi:hypothetical protein